MNDLFYFVGFLLAWPVKVMAGFMVGLATIEAVLLVFRFPLRNKGEF